MRNALRCRATLLLVLCPLASATAQTSRSFGLVSDHYAGFPCYVLTGQISAASGVFCNPLTNGGSGYVSTSSNNSARSVRAATSLSQSGGGGSQSATATAYSTQWSSILVNGASSAGDNLVFHFLTSRAVGFLGTNGGSMQSYYEFHMNGSSGSAVEWGVDYPAAAPVHYLANAAVTGIGLDFTLSLSGFSGAYDYSFQSYVETYHSNDQYSGAFGSSVYDATLQGIDAVDARGNLLASAVFLQDGTATLSVTPEPATLTLVGSGLSVFAGFALNRRRA